MQIQVSVEPALERAYPGFASRFAVVTDINVKKVDGGLEAFKSRTLGELRTKHGAASITEIPHVVLFRSFFKAMGVDPSRFRSPPEYLLRRALADRFPSVNTLVDICLLLTAKHWVTVSAFDAAGLKGRVTMMLAKGSETIQTIDGRTVALTPGEIILRDEEKVLSAYTVGDAQATMVTTATREALVTLWNAPGIPEQNLDATLAELRTLVAAYTSGVVEEIKPS
ncbi:MAG: phenylalanine--tRNA ligase beta subunit-related protein [Candidatus Bathyarchaeia archaeon]